MLLMKRGGKKENVDSCSYFFFLSYPTLGARLLAPCRLQQHKSPCPPAHRTLPQHWLTNNIPRALPFPSDMRTALFLPLIASENTQSRERCPLHQLIFVFSYFVCVCLYEMMAPRGPHPQRSLDLSPNHSIYLTYLFMVCLCDDAGFKLSSNSSWWKVQCYWLSIRVGEFAQRTMFLEDNACFFFIPCMFQTQKKK